RAARGSLDLGAPTWALVALEIAVAAAGHRALAATKHRLAPGTVRRSRAGR
ncbi:MAG: hypothetical protein QOD24_3019, partial [Solirubrobacteraceae bacterium]|nr:hypothetical protein [Solirubrobacteraceae bacterium]